ncbi:MAG: hypothetical protein JWN34_2303 [Bryobacterales bacterium]|nr:hypothetical protein [Bryobacterales bacterium]
MTKFRRSLAHVESDPPAAITAACAILEALFKIYIEDHEGLAMPSDQSVKPLWKTASKHLGLDPAAVQDDDIRKIPLRHEFRGGRHRLAAHARRNRSRARQPALPHPGAACPAVHTRLPHPGRILSRNLGRAKAPPHSLKLVHSLRQVGFGRGAFILNETAEPWCCESVPEPAGAVEQGFQLPRHHLRTWLLARTRNPKLNSPINMLEPNPILFSASDRAGPPDTSLTRR